MTTQDSVEPANRLIDLIGGHRVTSVIYVAAKLGIADHLADRPCTASNLAQLTNTHERSLLRLMRALVALGICAEAPDGTFKLTETGSHLAAMSERSLKAWVIVEGELLTAGWADFIESIRTGKTGAELAGSVQDRFELLASSGQAGIFNEGMVSLTRVELPTLLAGCDFSGISTLMDVGGGVGELMVAILERYPAMRGIVFDLPHCEEAARKNLANLGLADRFEFIPGNFFESIPAGADAIIMKTVIHDWNDERCVTILRNCHRALKHGARLMVVDRIMPEKFEPTSAHLEATLMDLNMLRGPGGRERTENEFRELLWKGGFHMNRVIPAGRYNVIEAAAASPP